MKTKKNLYFSLCILSPLLLILINNISIQRNLLNIEIPLLFNYIQSVTITPSPFVPTITATSLVSQQDILGVYKDLVDANKETVKAAHNTLNLVMTLISIVSVIIIGAGLFSILKIRDVLQEADQAKKGVKNLEDKINSDINILDQLHTIYSVDQYAIRVFSDISTDSIRAKKELLQLIKHSDPIIRRECLRTFFLMPNMLEEWWDINIYSQIKYMKDNDIENGIRCEAKYTLNHWENMKKKHEKN